MYRRRFLRGAALTVITARFAPLTLLGATDDSVLKVESRDGTAITVEATGTGPRMVLVHGGVGDHTRWRPLYPLLRPAFTIAAMDRRGHGTSGDSPKYTIHKEAEDIAAVMDSRPDHVFLLGHSYGAICALEATFLTSKVTKLVLYEPPIETADRSIDDALIERIEGLVQHGKQEEALIVFLREVVKVPAQEIEAAKTRSTWAGRVADIHSSIREMRALESYRFDAARMRELKVPTLLLMGSETASHHKRAIAALSQSIPNQRVHVFHGQGHNAMDTAAAEFVEVVKRFLLAATG